MAPRLNVGTHIKFNQTGAVVSTALRVRHPGELVVARCQLTVCRLGRGVPDNFPQEHGTASAVSGAPKP